jgi:competence protein ComEC
MTSRNAPPDCAAQVIGRSLLRERGALALRRTGSGFVMDSARGPHFDRPWAPQRLRAADTANPTPVQPAASRALPRDATPRQDDIEADQ